MRLWGTAGRGLPFLALAAAAALGCAGPHEPGRAAALPPLTAATELNDRLGSDDVPLLLDTRPAARYGEAHVPGAVPFDARRGLGPAGELDEPTRTRLMSLLEENRVRRDSAVLAIDDGSREGFARAALACWTLALADVPGCAVLDGGIDAWRTAGGKPARGIETPAVAAPVPAPERPKLAQRPTALAALDTVRRATFEPDTLVIDVRELRDATEIPGALRLPLSALVAGTGRVDPAALRKRAAERGLYAERSIVVVGESADEAAAAWFALARVAGIRGVRAFAGGLPAWRAHPLYPPVEQSTAAGSVNPRPGG
ncbi:MAG: hypothetical protein KBD01_14345 [Acidobacteria bacterium]|nr:hypothetical protein [Acidobacteriota bacterium]